MRGKAEKKNYALSSWILLNSREEKKITVREIRNFVGRRMMVVALMGPGTGQTTLPGKGGWDNVM